MHLAGTSGYGAWRIVVCGCCIYSSNAHYSGLPTRVANISRTQRDSLRDLGHLLCTFALPCLWRPLVSLSSCHHPSAQSLVPAVKTFSGDLEPQEQVPWENTDPLVLPERPPFWLHWQVAELANVHGTWINQPRSRQKGEMGLYPEMRSSPPFLGPGGRGGARISPGCNFYGSLLPFIRKWNAFDLFSGCKRNCLSLNIGGGPSAWSPSIFLYSCSFSFYHWFFPKELLWYPLHTLPPLSFFPLLRDSQ